MKWADSLRNDPYGPMFIAILIVCIVLTMLNSVKIEVHSAVINKLTAEYCAKYPSECVGE